MRNLIAIVVLALSFVSVGFGQTDTVKIDTNKFVEILEKEFNFQVNVYRKSKGLDTMPTNEYLKSTCESNNDRLNAIPMFFNRFLANKEFREIAHEDFDCRYDEIYDPPRPCLPHNFNEIVYRGLVNLTNDTVEIKKIAKKVQKAFAGSPDHNEALLEKYGFGIYNSFKVIIKNKMVYIVCTSVIINYIK